MGGYFDPNIFDPAYFDTGVEPAGRWIAVSFADPSMVDDVGGFPSATTFRRYPAVVLVDKPVGFWRLDQLSGSTATDTSGKGHNGTYTNTPTLGVTGPIEDGSPGITLLAASNEYVRVTDHADFDVGNGPLSIEMWIKRTRTATNEALLAKGTGAYFLRIHSDETLRLSMEGTGDGIASSATIADTNWHHVVATWDNTSPNSRIYIDGVDVSGSFNSRTLTDTATDLFIGIVDDLSQPFDGSLKDVSIYKSILSPARVSTRYVTAALRNRAFVGSGL